MIDDGANVSVCGKAQFVAYCKFVSLPIPATLEGRAPEIYAVNKTRLRVSGSYRFRIPVGDDFFIVFDAYVTEDDETPLIMALPELWRYKCNIDCESQCMRLKSSNATVRLTARNGHLFYEWRKQVLFTHS